eukprot:4781020-Pleurochrysis_carterae.AAC.1
MHVCARSLWGRRAARCCRVCGIDGDVRHAPGRLHGVVERDAREVVDVHLNVARRRVLRARRQGPSAL